MSCCVVWIIEKQTIETNRNEQSEVWNWKKTMHWVENSWICLISHTTLVISARKNIPETSCGGWTYSQRNLWCWMGAVCWFFENKGFHCFDLRQKMAKNGKLNSAMAINQILFGYSILLDACTCKHSMQSIYLSVLECCIYHKKAINCGLRL